MSEFRYDTLHAAFEQLTQQHPDKADVILKARANLTGYVRGMGIGSDMSDLMKAVRESADGSNFVGSAHGVCRVQIVARDGDEPEHFLAYIGGRTGLTAEDGYVAAMGIHQAILEKGQEWNPAWSLYQHTTLVELVGATNAMLLQAASSGHEPLLAYAFENKQPAPQDTRPVMMMRCETPSMKDLTWVLQEVHSSHENFRGADGGVQVAAGSVWVNKAGRRQLRQARQAEIEAAERALIEAQKQRLTSGVLGQQGGLSASAIQAMRQQAMQGGLAQAHRQINNDMADALRYGMLSSAQQTVPPWQAPATPKDQLKAAETLLNLPTGTPNSIRDKLLKMIGIDKDPT